MILADYNHQTGKSCRTIALRNMMARNGFDWKEDFLFGLANGLNFSFASPNESAESTYFKCLSPNLFQFESFAENIGLEYHVISKADSDYEFMEEVLKYDDNPVLCEVSPEPYKKYLKTDEQFWTNLKLDVPIASHITEVIGIEDGQVYFCENYSNKVFHVPQKVFSKARNMKKDSYLNPHHKIHYFMIPEDLENLNLESAIKKAIKSNITTYCDGTNERLGKRAFDLFMETFPDLYGMYGEKVCQKSLMITGNLIKYVSPGMFRKLYARFLTESAARIGYEEELDKISRLLNQSDFLWNKYASHLLKNDISVEERMNGAKTRELMDKIQSVETEFVERLVEISKSW